MEKMLQILMMALATASISTTVTKSSIFAAVRAEAERIGWFRGKLGELFHCPYCFAHWVALFLVFVCSPQPTSLTDAMVQWFAIVTLSTPMMALIVHSVRIFQKEGKVDAE